MSVRRIGARAVLAGVGVLACVGIMAVPSWGATSCTGPLGPATITGNISAGAGCSLEPGTTVTGSVTVHPGGSLFASEGFVIMGNVTSNEATEVRLGTFQNPDRGVIGGGVTLNKTTARIDLEYTEIGRVRIINGVANLLVEGDQ